MGFVLLKNKKIVFQIWDTGGQERFQSLGSSLFRGADCCVLVFDVTNAKSFASLNNWRDVFIVHANIEKPESFPFVVLGNKVDSDVRTVYFMQHSWYDIRCIGDNNTKLTHPVIVSAGTFHTMLLCYAYLLYSK